MKYNQWNTFLLLSTAVFAVACDQEKSQTPILDKVAPETAELVKVLDDYTFDEKALYIEGMQKQLRESVANLDRYTDSIGDSRGLLKTEIEPQIEGLRELSVSLHEKLAEANKATEETWMVVTDELGKGVAEFRESSEMLGNKIDAGVSEPSEESSEPAVSEPSGESSEAAVGAEEVEGSEPTAEPEQPDQP